MDLVSIGVPVRNGAGMLREALDSLMSQDYPALDIILSDNASTDETADICSEYAARDRRFRYIRHSRPLTALQNFKFCAEQARGRWWMWAAHDDLRTANYVDILVQGAKAYPSAAVVFTDVCLFADRRTREPLQKLRPEDMEVTLSKTTSLMARQTSIARAHLRGYCTQLYGLIRHAALEGYNWVQPPIAPDVPLIHYLASKGDLRHVPGATFFYYRSPTSEAARYMSTQRWWAYDEMVAQTANVVINSLPDPAARASQLAKAQVFFAIGSTLHGGARGWAWHYLTHLYAALPGDVQERWRSLKRGRLRGLS